ncbi:Uncharacterized protein TCM_040955 [Theobroma cacao]|uniref:G-patch domain-containing protein n=1 Tax=Theobroma cacao TaxID=3641 RepID=A0A061GUS4_THECC|nr:Uncharacterized protein TCM_040955 [Theobroma cacao]
MLFMSEGSKIPTSRLSKASKMIIKQIVERRCRVGFGLGKGLQGIKRPLSMVKSKEIFGLGYEPIRKERFEIMSKKKKNRMARLKGME